MRRFSPLWTVNRNLPSLYHGALPGTTVCAFPAALLPLVWVTAAPLLSGNHGGDQTQVWEKPGGLGAPGRIPPRW